MIKLFCHYTLNEERVRKQGKSYPREKKSTTRHSKMTPLTQRLAGLFTPSPSVPAKIWGYFWLSKANKKITWTGQNFFNILSLLTTHLLHSPLCYIFVVLRLDRLLHKHKVYHRDLFSKCDQIDSTKWSKTLKQFVGCCRRTVWVFLTILWWWFCTFIIEIVNGKIQFLSKGSSILFIIFQRFNEMFPIVLCFNAFQCFNGSFQCFSIDLICYN